MHETLLACRYGGTPGHDGGGGGAAVIGESGGRRIRLANAAGPVDCPGRDLGEHQLAHEEPGGPCRPDDRRGLDADGFGACVPKSCEWGLIPGTSYGPDVSARIGGSFQVKWNFGFSRVVLLAKYSPFSRWHVPTLTIDEYTIFTDGSHRSNYEVTETFIKGKPIRPQRLGIPATDYPLGDSPRPYPGLIALWVNRDPHANLRAVILSVNANHMLQVHAFGNCVPHLCNWGTVNGITFGSNIYSKTGSVFLAPYKFSFAKKLLAGFVNVRGNRLTVDTWTEFTDFSGRSNYETTDTFYPVR